LDESSLIQVRVTGVSSLREVIGKDAPVSVNSGSTVNDLIDKLEEEFGSTYRKRMGEELKDTIRKLFTLTINGKVPTPIRNFDEALSHGDEIVFFQWTGA
jgi:molybdopterin converting factor small subunit